MTDANSGDINVAIRSSGLFRGWEIIADLSFAGIAILSFITRSSILLVLS